MDVASFVYLCILSFQRSPSPQSQLCVARPIEGRGPCCPLLWEQARTYPDTCGKATTSARGLRSRSASTRALSISTRIKAGRPSCSRRPPSGIPQPGPWLGRLCLGGERSVPGGWGRVRKRSSSTSRRFRVCRSWMCSTSAAIGAMSSHVLGGSTWIRSGNLRWMPPSAKVCELHSGSNPQTLRFSLSNWPCRVPAGSHTAGKDRTHPRKKGTRNIESRARTTPNFKKLLPNSTICWPPNLKGILLSSGWT